MLFRSPYSETGLHPPLRFNSSILETGGSNGSLFRTWIATPLFNGSIFRNSLQPYLETFRKATVRFNGSIFRKRWFQCFPIQKLDCNPHFQLFHLYKNHLQPYLETFNKATPVPTVPYLETGGYNGSLFRMCLQPPVPTFPY